jgi:hypothetical protein
MKEAPERIEDIEIDDYVFMVRNSAGEEMKIYTDGQITGFPMGFSIVINRIDALIAEAGQLGYDEAMSRITAARRQHFLNMVGTELSPMNNVIRDKDYLEREVMRLREQIARLEAILPQDDEYED